MMKLRYNRCLVCPVRGLCCYFAVFLDDDYLKEPLNLILTNHPCIYLNTDTGLCKVYKDRKEYYSGCLSVEEGKNTGSLPVGCLYLKKGEVYPKPLKIMPPKDLEYYYQAIYDCENNKPHNEIQKLEKITEKITIK